MQWLHNGHAWVTEEMMNAVGTEWPRLGFQGYDECSGYGMATPGLPRI